MGKKSKAPPPPDYIGAANATAAGNLAAAKYATEANRVTQINPYGQVGWAQDANGKWTETTTFDPKLQASLDSQMAVQQGLSDQAQSMIGRVGDAYSQNYVAPDRGAYTGAAGTQNLDSVGKAGTFTSGANQDLTFNSTAPGLNTTYDRFSQTTPGQITDVGQFGAAGAGQDTRNLGAAGYTAGANDVSQNAVDYLGGLNDTNQRSASYQTGVAPVNQNIASALGGVNMTNQDARSQLKNVLTLNQNAPQFNQDNAQLYAQKAYDAQMALMRPDLEEQQQKLQNSLALQGLGVTSEANQMAQYGQSRARAAQENALANSSYASGAEQARGNYASQLAGFNASNAARDQAFNQGMNIFGANNQAQSQAFGQGKTIFDSNNAAQAQAYGQASNNFTNDNAAQAQAFAQRMGVFGANNSAQNQAFNQGLATQSGDLAATAQANAARNTEFNQGLQGFNAQQGAVAQANQARGTAFDQSANTFGMNQDALSAENVARQNMFAQQLQAYQAQNQAASNQFGQDQGTYNSSLDALRTNQDLQNAQNNAQNQAYAQAVQNYNMDAQASELARSRPLNEMNALLTGQQVQSPAFGNYYLQDNPGGPDILGATKSGYEAQMAAYNAQQASKSSTLGAVGSLAMAAATAY